MLYTICRHLMSYFIMYQIPYASWAVHDMSYTFNILAINPDKKVCTQLLAAIYMLLYYLATKFLTLVTLSKV
jgi:hypothetical protein